MSEIYQQIIGKIVEKQKEIIGEVALKQAENLSFIHLEDEKVDIDEEVGLEDVEDLLKAFKGVVGQGAVAAGRQALEEFDPDVLADMDLPEEILPKEVKFRKFASAF